jgi:hypothetical protein
MKDTTSGPGFDEKGCTGPLDVSRYDARIGDSRLVINQKLVALGYELTRIYDAFVEVHKARTEDTSYRQNQAASLAYKYFTREFKILPSRSRHLIQVAKRFCSNNNRQLFEVFSWTDLRTLASCDDIEVRIAFAEKLRLPSMTNEQLVVFLREHPMHSAREISFTDSPEQ